MLQPTLLGALLFADATQLQQSGGQTLYAGNRLGGESSGVRRDRAAGVCGRGGRAGFVLTGVLSYSSQ